MSLSILLPSRYNTLHTSLFSKHDVLFVARVVCMLSATLKTDARPAAMCAYGVALASGSHCKVDAESELLGACFPHHGAICKEQHRSKAHHCIAGHLV